MQGNHTVVAAVTVAAQAVLILAVILSQQAITSDHTLDLYTLHQDLLL